MDRASLFNYSNGERFIGKSAEEIFSEIESNNIWEAEESVSGAGSTCIQTQKIIEKIPLILEQLKIKTIFDIPCGDFNWFCKIDLTNRNYIGGDIVKNIINRNNEKFGSDNIEFIQFDILEDSFTQKDLVFCRDCLVHFSFNDICKAINNIKASGSKYLMATTFPDEPENNDIITGGWRPINLCLEPFKFSKPILLLNENCTEMNGVFSDKSLAVWELDEIII